MPSSSGAPAKKRKKVLKEQEAAMGGNTLQSHQSLPAKSLPILDEKISGPTSANSASSAGRAGGGSSGVGDMDFYAMLDEEPSTDVPTTNAVQQDAAKPSSAPPAMKKKAAGAAGRGGGGGESLLGSVRKANDGDAPSRSKRGRGRGGAKEPENGAAHDGMELDDELEADHRRGKRSKMKNKDGEQTPWKYIHNGPEAYRATKLRTQQEKDDFDAASANQVDAIAEALEVDWQLVSRRKALREKIEDLKQRVADAGTSTKATCATTKKPAGRVTNTKAGAAKQDGDAETKQEQELRASLASARKDLKAVESELSEARRETLLPLYMKATKDDVEYGDDVVSVSGTVVRNYPPEWMADERDKREKEDKDSEERKKFHDGDVCDWEGGDEFEIRVSWPLSMKTKPYREELTESERRKAFAELLDGGADAEKKKKKERSSLLVELWDNHIAGSVVEKLLRRQNGWHSKNAPTDWILRPPEQVETDKSAEDDPNSASKGDNMTEVHRRLRLFATEMAMQKGQTLLVNANKAAAGTVRPLEAAGCAVLEIVDDVTYYRPTVSEPMKAGGLSFEAEYRRVRVLQTGGQFEALQQFLHKPMSSNRRCNQYEARAIAAHLAAAHKLGALGGGGKQEREKAQTGRGAEAVAGLVKHPAAKGRKIDGTASLFQRTVSMRQLETVEAIPEGMLRQGAKESQTAPKMRQVFEIFREYQKQGKVKLTLRPNVRADPVPSMSLGYADTRNTTVTSMTKKITADTSTKRMWRLLCEIAREEAPRFEWTAVTLGWNIRTAVHVDANNAKPGRTFTCGDYTDVVGHQLPGAEDVVGPKIRPSGRLFVCDDVTEGGAPELPEDATAERRPYLVEFPVQYRGKRWEAGAMMSGVMINTHNRFTTFDGRRPHATEPWALGDRLCCTYFSKSASAEVTAELKRLGGNPPSPSAPGESSDSEEPHELQPPIKMTNPLQKKQKAGNESRAELGGGGSGGGGAPGPTSCANNGLPFGDSGARKRNAPARSEEETDSSDA